MYYVLSYSGIIPYLLILIDKYFFFNLSDDISINFFIYYSIIIIVFIGSTNWNFQEKVTNKIIFLGFLPSLFSTLIIFLNLLDFSKSVLLILIFVFLYIQLIFEYLLVFKFSINKKIFYILRLPLTFFISLALILIKFGFN